MGVFSFFWKGNRHIMLYSYDGPVKQFNNIIICKWHATTIACSIEKARSNMVYQYKKKFGLSPQASIMLPGKITELEDDDNGIYI